MLVAARTGKETRRGMGTEKNKRFCSQFQLQREI
jgi:hypothetical protein